MRDHIIVVGAGKFGSYLATNLSVRGEDVVLIDKDKDAFKNLADEFVGFEILDDACEPRVLEEAEVTKASQVIVCTDSDNKNIYIAHICGEMFNVPKVIVRQSSDDKLSLLADSRYKIIYPFSLSVSEYYSLISEEKE